MYRNIPNIATIAITMYIKSFLKNPDISLPIVPKPFTIFDPVPVASLYTVVPALFMSLPIVPTSFLIVVPVFEITLPAVSALFAIVVPALLT